MNSLKVIIMIPCRMDGERLPGKLMLPICGKPLFEWTWRRALRTGVKVVVVMPFGDSEIISHCNRIGAEYVLTDAKVHNGTQRCSLVLKTMKTKEVDVIVNWQCDEPLVEPKDVLALINYVYCSGKIGTLVAPGDCDQIDPNTGETHRTSLTISHFSRIPKVIVGENGTCHWFSRLHMHSAKLHCGVYAFGAETLLELGRIEPTELSRAASLEQLAWIENGHDIKAVEIDELPLSINTRDDYLKFRRTMEG